MKELFRQHTPTGVYIVALAVFLSIWHWKTTGHLSPSAVAIFASFTWMTIIYGGLFLRMCPLSPGFSRGLTPRFFFGYFIVNTSVAILSLISGFSVASSFLIVAAGALPIQFIHRFQSQNAPESKSFIPDLLCVLICGSAATLWCADALSPTLIDGKHTIFRVWLDSFNHTRIISAFSLAHGTEGVTDIRMSGVPPFFYHYASYFLPAAFVSLTGTSAFDVFVGFQIPFGIMLTGLAAFAFASSLWGFWPGLAASCALVLLPDAYQQGFGSRFLSYNFLQQVNLGGLYGVSCVAAAWIFILNGCRAGKYWPILIGYAFILLTLVYKSQIFVANSFLAMMYPCLFFRGVPVSRRWLVGISFFAVFAAAVWLSQQSEAVPTLRLDFSSTGAYAGQLFRSYDSGLLQKFFQTQILSGQSNIIAGLVFAGMILLSSFGLWGLACAATFLRLKTKLEPAVLFFPLLLVINYLLMSLGLAMDTRAIGAPEELLNRPVVWAYFGLVAWTAGAAYSSAFGDRLPEGRYARGLIALFTLLSFTVPWLFARNLQTFPAWGFGSFADFGRFPTCLVRASHYVREHSLTSDVVQDSANDRNLLVGALAERQDFAVEWMFGKGRKGLKERLDGLASFKLMTSETELMAYVAKNKIGWYLLRPETNVSWPEGFREKYAFECDGYRVYRFPTSLP